MKLIKKSIFKLFVTFTILSTLQCSSSKYKLQETPAFQFDSVYFQEWYAGIKVGGTGINMYFPNLNDANTVTMDSVYFRNLKGKLVRGRSMYSAILKNRSPYDTTPINPSMKPAFKLLASECVVSYIEKGEIKYFKLKNINEREGVYYEDGPPTTMATVD
ncbi:MAG: hypothetical protein KDD03_07340 [Gelidibacter sp.]|nr:hypothetical protein [Gelidibacter sp.]